VSAPGRLPAGRPGDGGDLGEDVALVEVLDRVLGQGVVLVGDITLAVAEVDLVRVGLQLFLGSTDTLRRAAPGDGTAP
jgi:hypothetical protein